MTHTCHQCSLTYWPAPGRAVFLEAITSVVSASGSTGVRITEQNHTFVNRAHHHRIHIRSTRKGRSPRQQMHVCAPGRVEATRADGWTFGMEAGSKLRPPRHPREGKDPPSRTTGLGGLLVLCLAQGPLSGCRQELPDRTEKPMAGNRLT